MGALQNEPKKADLQLTAVLYALAMTPVCKWSRAFQRPRTLRAATSTSTCQNPVFLIISECLGRQESSRPARKALVSSTACGEKIRRSASLESLIPCWRLRQVLSPSLNPEEPGLINTGNLLPGINCLKYGLGAVNLCMAGRTQRKHQVQNRSSRYAVMHDNWAFIPARGITDAASVAVALQNRFA